jgi:hypothetical protein
MQTTEVIEAIAVNDSTIGLPEHSRPCAPVTLSD